MWFTERNLEKEMATHSSTLAWKIPWSEKPGRPQSMESQRVGQGFQWSQDKAALPNQTAGNTRKH